MTENEFKKIKEEINNYLPVNNITTNEVMKLARRNVERNYYLQILGTWTEHSQILFLEKLRIILNYIHSFTGGFKHPDGLVGSADVSLRLLKSMNVYINEIMVQLEQGYWFTALGTVRRAFELLFVSDMSDRFGSDFYLNAIWHGNNSVKEFESFFGPNISEESKMASVEIAKIFTEKQLSQSYGWVNKYDPTFKGITNYFDNKLNPIMRHALMMSHKLNHYSSFVLALDDKKDLYNNLSQYAINLVLVSVFNISKTLLSNVMNKFDENKDILMKTQLYRVKKIMVIAMEFIDEVELSFVGLEELIKQRRKDNGWE